MKAIIKIVIAALVIHATYRAVTVYMRYYEFKDDVSQIAQFGVRSTDNQLANEVLATAKRRELPVDPSSIKVRRQNSHIIIDASYVEQVEIVPRYFYPWEAKVHVDILTLVLQEAK
jgi:hypothetical protein